VIIREEGGDVPEVRHILLLSLEEAAFGSQALEGGNRVTTFSRDPKKYGLGRAVLN